MPEITNLRNRMATTAMACALAVGTQGCASRTHVSLLDPLAGGATEASLTWDQVLARRLQRPGCRMPQLRQAYEAAPGSIERRHVRNEFAYAGLGLIEEYAQRSRIRLATIRSAHGAAGDIAIIGLTTAATLASGEAIKSALSAAAAAVAGTNHALDARFLNEQTTPAIIAQMELNHRAHRERIESRLRECDDAAYPLAAAELDLLECLYAGTPASAVAALTDAVAQRRAAGLVPWLALQQPKPTGTNSPQ